MGTYIRLYVDELGRLRAHVMAHGVSRLFDVVGVNDQYAFLVVVRTEEEQP